jgi:hypothetical protein
MDTSLFDAVQRKNEAAPANLRQRDRTTQGPATHDRSGFAAGPALATVA